jgi:hypothetical protein
MLTEPHLPAVGGHSGLNISEDRGNAVVMLAQTIAAMRGAVSGIRVAQMAGGDKRNAIPREAWAELLVSRDGQQVVVVVVMVVVVVGGAAHPTARCHGPYQPVVRVCSGGWGALAQA